MEKYDDKDDGQVYFIFRKPFQLQNIFDKYLPTGPTMSQPHDPMWTACSQSFDVDDLPTYDVKEF